MPPKPQMCANHGCALHGVKRMVLGGCESCGDQLVPWEDPDEPTTEQLARLIVDVARFEGKSIPLEPIERSLRNNPSIRAQWVERYKEVMSLSKGTPNVTDAQWLKLIETVKDERAWQIKYPPRSGDDVILMSPAGIYCRITPDGERLIEGEQMQ